MSILRENITPRQPTLRPLTAIAATMVVCALITGLVLTIFIYRTNAASYYLQLTRERQMLHTASVLRYGIVESVHPEFNVIVVKLASNFSPNAEPPVVSVQILPLTRISRQDMQEQNGIYYSLSPLTPITIADLAPGDRVAMLLDTSNEEPKNIVARVVVAGHPL